VSVDRRAARRRLVELVAQQGGYLTAAQARDVGYSYQAQAHHVGAGNWIRVGRGLFRLAEWAPRQHDDLFRWLLWSGGQGVISHESALSVHGVGEFESARVHLTVPVGFRRIGDGVVIHHADLESQDVDIRPGFPVTSVTRSLVDVAAAGADEEQLGRAVREALNSGEVTLRDLRARADAIDAAGALRIERALTDQEST
jgi:predicted transcriptional regulator of viral defense system